MSHIYKHTQVQEPNISEISGPQYDTDCSWCGKEYLACTCWD